MRFLLPILAALACVGCAHTKAPQYSAPTVATVRQDGGKARTATTEAKTSAATTKENIAAAKQDAVTILTNTPEMYRPVVLDLRDKLDAAEKANTATGERLDQAMTALDDLETHATTLQADITRQTTQLNTEVAEKNAALSDASKYKAEASLQRGLAWKWRLFCLGGVLAVGAWFLAPIVIRMIRPI